MIWFLNARICLILSCTQTFKWLSYFILSNFASFLCMRSWLKTWDFQGFKFWYLLGVKRWLTKNWQVSFMVYHENFRWALLQHLYWENPPWVLKVWYFYENIDAQPTKPLIIQTNFQVLSEFIWLGFCCNLKNLPQKSYRQSLMLICH